MTPIVQTLATELAASTQQVNAAIGLLDEGATVPFIARYRKEVTGGLDDIQLRLLEERLRYLRELEERRATILASIAEQDKLTPELERDIRLADTKTRLEDLYLPYKKKRRTKGQIAIEAGLQPLADALYNDPSLEPELEAAKYLNADASITDNKAALDGARFILMERFAEDAELLGRLRDYLWQNGLITAQVSAGKETEGAKFRDYFEHSEAIKTAPSHRALALFRARKEAILSLSIKLPDEDSSSSHPCAGMIASRWNINDQGRPADKWLSEVVRWTWRIKLYTHIETDLLGQLRERAENEAIEVFSNNLKDLLLAAPAGPRATIGLDPGLRTGCKVALVDATGKVLDHCAIFPTPPQNRIEESIQTLAHLAKKHGAELVAIGNGTASRETDRFVGQLINDFPQLGLKKVMVNEAGASVYSASELASREFPDLDVTIRGAVSIARRLQDPLAELVKIDPKSIGVGQYQHDVSQTALARQLNSVVEDCVNGVGVDVNTASAPLLTRVSGLNRVLAENIVNHRDTHGAFANRKALRAVPRLGDKTFEQAAGFLRVMNGDNPLDTSAVHPESYELVETIANTNERSMKAILGDKSFLKNLKPATFVNEKFGLPTVTDIISELEKPGRDPRGEFKTADFTDGVEEMKDLEPGMILEGSVTNVTNFGAFVDVGVHQDGLVHISALADTFIKDPRDVVKAGDVVRVKVIEVDMDRRRIALSMRMADEAKPREERQPRPSKKVVEKHQKKQQPANSMGSLGQALLNASTRKR
ncbi:MAG: Tex family protein [Pseudomonadales bacterium]